jgi:type IV pilus assembly protein PilZ
MAKVKTITLDCHIQSQTELNLSYIPFITEGGLFVPTTHRFYLGDSVYINLTLPMQLTGRTVEAKIIWITPKNALYHVYSGIGVQMAGPDAKAIMDEIKANLDNKMEVGGYIFGIKRPEMIPA